MSKHIHEQGESKMTNEAQSAKAHHPRGFLRRLAADTTGNSLMLITAAMIPMAAMIGSAVDMSRAYLVKSRLQTACDAGTLAGRKFMTDNGWTADTQTKAQSFFNNNFPTGTYGSENTSFTPTVDATGEVDGTASTRIPMTIMKIFNQSYQNINVACSAKIEIANTDVMFVLDVTGSMASCPNGSGSCGGGAGSKIEGLREAVLDFYDTLAASTTAASQLRFGFVPYSTNVNIGGIIPVSNFVDAHTYQSAVANMTTQIIASYTSRGAPSLASYEDYPAINASTNQANCGVWGNPTTALYVSGTAPTVQGIGFSNNNTDGIDWGSFSGATDTSGTNRSCRRIRATYTFNGATIKFGLTNWTFQPTSYDVSQFKLGTAVSIADSDPTGFVATSGAYNRQQLAAVASAGTTNGSYTWNGCIEERDTVAQATFAPIPAAAYDLQIDTPATDQATRWRPSFPDVVLDRSAIAAENSTTLNAYGQPSSPCPAASKKLAAMTRSQVETYVNSLNPTGNTYHDVGMVWGARLLSPTGMFASENAAAPNGRPISRHIVFMTDGDMCPASGAYNFQAFEKLDRRVMGSTSPDDCSGGEMENRHNARFLALCASAKAMNLSVWTVAFGTSNPPTLVSCANANQAFVATDTITLKQKFQQIAAKIADLRLTQ
jgi:Flp pilus assembly protein TadG